MNTEDITTQNLSAAEAKIPSGSPVTMLNLVQFYDRAQYAEANQTPCSGMEAYLQRYAPAFREVAAELRVEGIEVIYVGTVAAILLGPAEPKWDAMAIVRYPSFAALRRVIESPAYLTKAEPHRRAALKAWEFVATFEPPSS